MYDFTAKRVSPLQSQMEQAKLPSPREPDPEVTSRSSENDLQTRLGHRASGAAESLDFREPGTQVRRDSISEALDAMREDTALHGLTPGFRQAVLEVFDKLQELKIYRKNRPDIREEAAAYPDSVPEGATLYNIRGPNNSVYRIPNLELAQSSPQEAQKVQLSWGETLAAKYEGTTHTAGHCDEHAHLTLHYLSKVVPLNELREVELHGKTADGRKVGHTFVIHCASGFPDKWLDPKVGLLDFCQEHATEVVFVDAWSRKKLSTFPRTDGPGTVERRLSELLLEVSPQACPYPFEFFEAAP